MSTYVYSIFYLASILSSPLSVTFRLDVFVVLCVCVCVKIVAKSVFFYNHKSFVA